jgi:O-antigen/teichoic acid export membrane protein
MNGMPSQTMPANAMPAPVTGWRRMLGDSLVVGGSTAICQALGAVTSLVFRLLLDPAEMGVWQGLKVFLSYANYANLGISKGATRELTIAMGRGDIASAQRGLNLAFTVNTATSFLYAIVLTVSGVWIGFSAGGLWSQAWGVGLVVVGGLAVLQRHVTFQVTIMRSKQDFAATSQLSVLEAVLTLAACGLAGWKGGLYGVYAGTLIVLVGSLLFLRSRGATPLAWDWNRKEVVRLIGIGSPILLAGVVATLFRSLDKLMILGYLDDREFQLGCYSLALMVTAQIYGLGNMLSIVMGPRYGETFGRSNDRREVARLAARASEPQAAALAILAVLAMVAAPPVLARILPDYQSGLAPLAWLVPGTVASAMALPANQYLIAVDGQRRALFALLIATGVAAGGNHLAFTGGYGLVGVAATTALAQIVYFVLLVGVSIWRELSTADRARYVASMTLAFGPTMGLALLTEPVAFGLGSGWMTAAVKASTFTVLWAAVVAFGWRYGGWGAAWREERGCRP